MLKLKNYQSFTESIKLIKQPDGISCGPTCLKMLAELFKINATIEELKIVCGTDTKTGTTDEKMIKGLDYLNFDWERFPLGDKQKAFDRLELALQEGNSILFRTLIQGVKHWIICDPAKDKFYIVDPWLGEYNLESDKLDEIWKARDYDGFMVKGIKPVTGTPNIEKIKPEEKKDIVDMAALVFTNVMSYKANQNYMNNSGVDFNNSVKLVLNGEVVGCYFIKPGNISRKEPGKGCEGFALAIKPGFRKYGWGEMLKDWFEKWAQDNGYDYVWGQHLSGLKNKEFWLKRRELYRDGEGLFTTIKRFRK